MSLTPDGDDRQDEAGDEERPTVPYGVLCGIEDVADGETASKEEIESVLDSS